MVKYDETGVVANWRVVEKNQGLHKRGARGRERGEWRYGRGE